MHQDFECCPHALGSERAYAGLAGLRAATLDWMGAWVTYRIEVEQLIDCGDRVLMLSREFARREQGQPEVTSENGHVWTVRDGKIVRWDSYALRPEALEAVGLA